MGFWDRLKKDIKKGIDEGLAALKEGTEVIKHKAEDVTSDVKKKVRIFEMKQKMQTQLAELGGRVYEVALDKRKNPFNDEKVKKVIEKIKKIHLQIEKLEGKTTEKPKKKAATKAKKTQSKKASTSKKKTSSKAKKTKVSKKKA
jgi:hypothetical protein